MHHQFFEGFFNSNIKNEPPFPFNNSKYVWNTIILELVNSWPSVRWLVYRHKENILKKINPVEKDWLEFISKNNIDILSYEKDVQKFFNDYFKENME